MLLPNRGTQAGDAAQAGKIRKSIKKSPKLGVFDFDQHQGRPTDVDIRMQDRKSSRRDI
jgi:hypothetical protein